MRKENEIDTRFVRAAANAYTAETVNRIIGICDDLLEYELPAHVKERLTEIDADCCRLLRDNTLLNNLLKRRADDSAKHCSFTDVYANCCRTIDAICRYAGAFFSYSEFIPACKLDISAENCCMLLLLPVALAVERDAKATVRLIASRKGGRLELEYAFSGEAPPVDKLAAECAASDHSNGLFFTEPLLALNLKEIASECGAQLTCDGKKLVISLPVADKAAEINSVPDSYIDNRLSLPYLMLSGISRREI